MCARQLYLLTSSYELNIYWILFVKMTILWNNSIIELIGSNVEECNKLASKYSGILKNHEQNNQIKIGGIFLN